MNQESRNSLLAIAACVAFYLVYSQYLSSRYPDMHKQPSQQQTSESEQMISKADTQLTPQTHDGKGQTNQIQEIAQLPAKDLLFENDVASVVFAQSNGGIQSIKLKNYKKHLNQNEFVELMAGTFSVQGVLTPNQTIPYNSGFFANRSGNQITFSRSEDNWKIAHTYELPNSGYVGRLRVIFINTSPEPRNLNATVLLRGYVEKDVVNKGAWFLPGAPAVHPRFVATYNTTDEFIEGSAFCTDSAKNLSGKSTKFNFIGYDSHYFLTVLIPKVPFGYEVRSGGTFENGACPIAIALFQDQGLVPSQKEVSYEFDTYFGPKDLQIISAYDEKLKVTLGLGWLDIIARPLLWSIKGLFSITHNYGIAIILLTLLLKILFYPLAKQSAVSMHKMKKLNPEMTAIREKYKKDPQKMQREMMAFMSKHKVNPMKGCLPILPQIPVFFALFRVLSASIELRHAPFFGWVRDLSVQDPYFITPIILGFFMFIQQKMTPMTGMDKTQERILMFMPLIFTVMMLTLPSGLVLYMLTNTIVSILQQKWLNLKLDKLGEKA